jgi:hypothetical protein
LPLTVSHPAAAWLVRRVAPRLPLDALVLGTMAPDFEYILRLRVYGRFGHTPLGLLLFCVPVGLVACAVFRALVRPAAMRHLPAGLRSPAPRHGWLASAAAVLVGAVTHVLWDSVTHGSADLAVDSPLLREMVAGVPVYHVLQHVSTLVGAVGIACWVRAWVRSHPAEARRYAPGEGRAALRVVGVIVTFAALAAVLNGARRLHASPVVAVGYAAVGGMAGLAAAAVAYGAATRRGGAFPG